MLENIETPTPVKKQIWGPWATAGLGIATGVIFTITQGIVTIAFLFARLAENPDTDFSRLIEQLLSDGDLLTAAIMASAVAGTGFVLLMVIIRGGEPLSEYLALKKISLKTALVMLAVTLAFLALSSLIAYFLDRPPGSDFIGGAYGSASFPFLFWVATVIFAPVFEELFLRGFVFTGFRYSRLGVGGAIILTAAAWALMHIQYSYYEMTVIFFLGIVLGFVRHRTGSLWSPLIIHSANNLIAMALVSFQ